MLGLAKSRRDLSRAAIEAAATCGADPLWAKSRAWTRQGDAPKVLGPTTGDYVDGTPAFAAWPKIPLGSGLRGRSAMPPQRD